MKTGIELILAERERQIYNEGWSAEHDNEHDQGELLAAANCYLRNYHMREGAKVPKGWPWDAKWWKPKNPIRNLVRAGALAVAEKDRLVRACATYSDLRVACDKAQECGRLIDILQRDHMNDETATTDQKSQQ